MDEFAGRLLHGLAVVDAAMFAFEAVFGVLMHLWPIAVMAFVSLIGMTMWLLSADDHNDTDVVSAELEQDRRLLDARLAIRRAAHETRRTITRDLDEL